MKNKLGKSLAYIELTIVALLVLIPMILIVLNSFSSSVTLAETKLIPTEFTLDNYVYLFQETPYIQWFWNTLQIAVLNVVLSVLVVMITAWVMSRFKFKGKKVSLMSILLLSMFPTFLSMTAIYTLFSIIGLIGNPISMVIIYVAGAIPYNTWLVKGYLDGIPQALDEAAYIDGAGKFRTFFQIVLPLSKPIITYVAVSQFMSPWMDYILPSMLLSRDEQKTLAVGLFGFIARSEEVRSTLFSAGAIVIGVPITILFLIFQKFLVRGISAGANKG